MPSKAFSNIGIQIAVIERHAASRLKTAVPAGNRLTTAYKIKKGTDLNLFPYMTKVFVNPNYRLEN
jgi:hypothetical protein